MAAFETGFHQTIPDRNRYYPIPWEWAEEHHVKRFGFHGASHRYIATRTAELLGRSDLRIISCHLGGSNSLVRARGGVSVATSMGMSPQSGVSHNNRVGDFDPFALPDADGEPAKRSISSWKTWPSGADCLGLSGVSGDVRDLEAAAAAGNARARLALDVFVAGIRNYLGAMLVELGGADAIVFTGGIGENGVNIRTGVCAGLEELGIQLDPAAQRHGHGAKRGSAPAASRTQVWVVPTNEEIIVARQTKQALESAGKAKK